MLFLPVLPLILSVCLFGQAPTFRSASSELVVLPVVVTDKRGQLVSDLDRDRFTLFDNGRRVPVELFTNEDTPDTVGIIIYTILSISEKHDQVLADTSRTSY